MVGVMTQALPQHGPTDLTSPWCYRCRTAGRVEVGAARSVYTGNQVVASCCTGVACCGAG